MTLKTNYRYFLIALLLTATATTSLAKKGRKGKPPEAAFAACSDQNEAGATCSFETDNGNIKTGICTNSRKDQEILVCKPDRGHKRQNQQ